MADEEDNPPFPCEHCNGTGVFAGRLCSKCGGRGYRLKNQGDKPRPRL